MARNHKDNLGIIGSSKVCSNLATKPKCLQHRLVMQDHSNSIREVNSQVDSMFEAGINNRNRISGRMQLLYKDKGTCKSIASSHQVRNSKQVIRTKRKNMLSTTKEHPPVLVTTSIT